MRSLSRFIFLVIGGCLSLSGTLQAQSPRFDETLTGVIAGKQNGTYVQVPFEAPPGMERLTVSFSYTNHQQHTILDIGIRDPERFRGWSGGNKSTFTIGLADATPSYLPGLILPGTWHLLIGVANVRRGQQTTYTAHIHFTPDGKAGIESFTAAPLETGARWYRGDLHMHTGNSDGTCPSQTGKMVPCPVFVTVEAAVKKHLDFIAITDHNAISQYELERALQPYFDKLLLIPGREVTTYYGHANLFGTTEYIDFMVGPDDMDKLYYEAHAHGALLSLNHPIEPLGEACIGCAWQAKDFNMRLPDMIEAINGNNPLLHTLDIAFWQKQLDVGIRVPVIGGSDTHRPMETDGGRAGVGVPTTVVWANELSVPAILAGIKAGHVFIDVAGTEDRMLTITATADDKTAMMGDVLDVPAGRAAKFSARVAHCQRLRFVWVIDGKRQKPVQLTADEAVERYRWTSDGARHDIRAMVLDAGDDNVEMVANPVYVDWPEGEK